MAKNLLSRLIFAGTLLILSLAMSGCSLIYEELEPCAPERSVRVPVTYTMNMAFADALPRQVKSLTLYVADSEGRVIETQTKSITDLAEDNYSFRPSLSPGTYQMLIWGAGESPTENPTSFLWPLSPAGDTPPPDAPLADYGARLPLEGNQGEFYSDRDIIPLFHGYEGKVVIPDVKGEVVTSPLDLTKDTNLIDVLIQSADGSALDLSNFLFSIKAANQELSYTNRVISTLPFRYHPWATTALTTDDNAEPIIDAILAEFTTGRLEANNSPRLIITRRSDGVDVLNIDLIKCLLLVKGEYNRQMTDQEYLDRNDRYSLIFFFDSAGEWDSHLGIYINGWRVVPPQSETT